MFLCVSKGFFQKSRVFIRTMSIFTQTLNPLTGTPSWEEKDPDYDYHQEVARSAFADMLHDHERNEKYFVALKAAIEKKHAAGLEANVLDIGTGTGLLSMMAAKCGADSIIACEAFKPMARCASEIIAENGYGGKIKLVYKRSTEMTVGENGDMSKRANILVTEVFDTELIGEGALSTFHHAHEFLLDKDCIVVPSSGRVWAQVVESSVVDSWNRINSIKNPDNCETLVDAPKTVRSCSGSSAVHDIQLTQLPKSCFTPLLPPQPIFEFDWSGKTPLIFKEKAVFEVKPIRCGKAQAVFMWWDLNMDTEGKVLLSCAPVWEHPEVKELVESEPLDKLADRIPWRDHWMQAIYYLPEEVPVNVDKCVSFAGYHDEYSFWFYLSDSKSEIPDDHQSHICSCYLHIAYSRTRIGQINDVKTNRKYLTALKKKLKPNSTVLCVSDGSLLSLSIAKMGAKKVFLLEPNSLSRKAIETFVKANDLVSKIEIIEDVNNLPENDKIDLIFGEPHFVNSILPWDNLRFWYIASRYSSDIPRIPCKAVIRGLAVDFKDLHKIRAPLGICEGFDLSIFDRLVQASSDKSDNPVEVHPLWEYPGTALSLPFDLMSFDLSKNVNDQRKVEVSNKVDILKDGVCTGVALWVDWYLDSDTMVSTGPVEEIIPGSRISWYRYVRQGVFLFRNISDVVSDKNLLSSKLTFVPSEGILDFQFSVEKKC